MRDTELNYNLCKKARIAKCNLVNIANLQGVNTHIYMFDKWSLIGKFRNLFSNLNIISDYYQSITQYYIKFSKIHSVTINNRPYNYIIRNSLN